MDTLPGNAAASTQLLGCHIADADQFGSMSRQHRRHMTKRQEVCRGAHPTMAALPLISSAVLLNLTGPRVIPSLGLPNALHTSFDPSHTAAQVFSNNRFHLAYALCTSVFNPTSGHDERHPWPSLCMRLLQDNIRLGEERGLERSLVEQAANDDQAIRPEVGEGEGVELAPHTDARPQLCDETEGEAHHCTTAQPCQAHHCHPSAVPTKHPYIHTSCSAAGYRLTCWGMRAMVQPKWLS